MTIAIAVLIARLLLAGVFLLAGVTKLMDLTGSRLAMAEFGLTETLAAFVGWMLPCAEIIVALGLLPVWSAPLAALAAFLLLGAFVAGIAINLWRGHTPDCHCFGQLHSEPIGAATLIRNAALILLAAFIIVGSRIDPGRSEARWIEGLSSGQQILLLAMTLAAVAAVVQGMVLLELARRGRRLQSRLEALKAGRQSARPGSAEALPVGVPAPAFSLEDADGRTVSLDDLLQSGVPLILFFTATGCAPCRKLFGQIAIWDHAHGDQVTFAIVNSGSAQDIRMLRDEHSLRTILGQHGSQLSRAYGSRGTPSAVVVRPDGTIGSQIVMGKGPIRYLVNTLLYDEEPYLPLAVVPPDAEDGKPFRLPEIWAARMDG